MPTHAKQKEESRRGAQWTTPPPPPPLPFPIRSMLLMIPLLAIMVLGALPLLVRRWLLAPPAPTPARAMRDSPGIDDDDDVAAGGALRLGFRVILLPLLTLVLLVVVVVVLPRRVSRMLRDGSKP